MTSKTSNRLAAIACVAAGILIAALPHFAGWTLTGRPYYVATIDDRFYLAIASQAYFNHPGRIADPVFVAGGTSLYRALQFLPGVWGAKLLGLDPLEIGLMWRVIAGATVGFGWYTLFRLKVERPWIAASLAVMLLGDSGLTHGLPLIRLGLTAVAIASKSPNYFQGGHWIHLEWRSVTPAMTMVYLLALVWSVLRPRGSDPLADCPGGSDFRSRFLRLVLLLDRCRTGTLVCPGAGRWPSPHLLPRRLARRVDGVADRRLRFSLEAEPAVGD